MTLRSLVIAVMLLSLAGEVTDCLAQTRKEPFPAEFFDQRPKLDQPMVFFIAKGGPDSCGKGCDTWIAAEGEIDSDAASRFRKFLRQFKVHGLPIYFSSSGGNLEQAFAIGRMLREKPTVASVGFTIARICGAAHQQFTDACRKLKRVGAELEAEISPRARCNSACSYILLGAANREVPLESSVGVHSGKVFLDYTWGLSAPVRARATERALDRLNRSESKYFADMGADRGLYELIRTVKFESVHFLTREELYRFRIDKREYVETVWALQMSSRPNLTKSAVSKASNSSFFRKVRVELSCLSNDRTLLLFLRDADKGDTGAASVSLTTGSDTPIMLTKIAGGDPFVWSAVLSSDEIEHVWATPKMQVTELASLENESAREKFLFETRGLEDGWRKMSAICQSSSADAAAK